MIFQQVLRRCAPGFVDPLVNDALHVTVTWKDPITKAPRSQDVGYSIAGLTAGETLSLRKAQAIVAYAEALKLVGPAATTALGAAHRRARQLRQLPELLEDPELGEIISLLELHPSFVKEAP